jgi:hypothetical protein
MATDFRTLPRAEVDGHVLGRVSIHWERAIHTR